MAKYNFELKKKIVLEHLSLGVGSKALAKKYNVKSARQIQQWIHNYNEFGEEGLKRSRQKNNYSFEFKLHMVESYLSNEVSYEELALANGITNYTMISRWVEAFRVATHSQYVKTFIPIPLSIHHKTFDKCFSLLTSDFWFLALIIIPSAYKSIVIFICGILTFTCRG